MFVRLVAGVVSGLIALAAALAGAQWWGLFVLGLLGVASLEWAWMANVSPVMMVITLILGFGLVLARQWVALPLLLLLPSIPLLYYQDPARGKDAIWSAGGILWLAIPSALIVFVRVEYGLVPLLVLLFGTILQDSLAYYTGYVFGGNTPFTPKLSPNKTWAGFIGGSVGMIVTFLVGGDLMGWPLFLAFPTGVVLGLTGQAGDLSISALKRQQEIDDTGALIPGHGGILDRTDALIFNVAVFFPLLKLVERYELSDSASYLVSFVS